MNQKNECREMIIRLHETPNIGWHTINKAVSAAMWQDDRNMRAERWRELGLKPQQANAAAAAMQMSYEKVEKLYEQVGATIVTYMDEEYPEPLKQIADYPWVLYAKGRIELLTRPLLAIVGTRVPSAYGKHTTMKLAEELSHEYLTIVSGLASGVDSLAHEAALKGPGSTIAVMGTGINEVYPPNHQSLYRRIAEQGLVITETPMGVKLHPGMFPLRNRIIAGMTFGTIVVEAAVSSGSLITADMAIQASREVFAVPGPINSPKSVGTNHLIRDSGAKLITSAADVIAELTPLQGQLEKLRREAAAGGRSARAAEPILTEEEDRLYRILQEKPLTMNELHELSALPFGHLNALLINLTIKRKIQQQSGSIYMAL
ncbi:DNA-processing protein DprA [Paenibacillus sp. GCM10023252]|uniref:DNA-processing protein DprA n=1 Tax=Paenibacillus sp. GCM10023252 TaxID=3252649 RepID=UPI00362240A9